jgi:anti-sigma B factor antagonist
MMGRLRADPLSFHLRRNPQRLIKRQGPFAAAPDTDAVEIRVMMRRPTKVISRKNGDVRIFKITGRLDPGDGPDQLFEMVQRFVEENEVNFLLDLRSVTYISSTGVGSLIKCYRTVLKEKGQVKLLSPSQSVRNILAISKLDGVFEIFSDESEALASFAERVAEKTTKSKKSK